MVTSVRHLILLLTRDDIAQETSAKVQSEKHSVTEICLFFRQTLSWVQLSNPSVWIAPKSIVTSKVWILMDTKHSLSFQYICSPLFWCLLCWLYTLKGSTVVQWAPLLPHSSRVLGLILSSGYCGFSIGYLLSSHIKKHAGLSIPAVWRWELNASNAGLQEFKSAQLLQP